MQLTVENEGRSEIASLKQYNITQAKPNCFPFSVAVLQALRNFYFFSDIEKYEAVLFRFPYRCCFFFLLYEITKTCWGCEATNISLHVLDRNGRHNPTYYMANPIFTPPLVNFRFIIYCMKQSFKSKCSFCSSNVFVSKIKKKERIKESYCVSINPKDFDADFVLPNFNLCLF